MQKVKDPNLYDWAAARIVIPKVWSDPSLDTSIERAGNVYSKSDSLALLSNLTDVSSLSVEGLFMSVPLSEELILQLLSSAHSTSFDHRSVGIVFQDRASPRQRLTVADTVGIRIGESELSYELSINGSDLIKSDDDRRARFAELIEAAALPVSIEDGKQGFRLVPEPGFSVEPQMAFRDGWCPRSFSIAGDFSAEELAKKVVVSAELMAGKIFHSAWRVSSYRNQQMGERLDELDVLLRNLVSLEAHKSPRPDQFDFSVYFFMDRLDLLEDMRPALPNARGKFEVRVGMWTLEDNEIEFFAEVSLKGYRFRAEANHSFDLGQVNNDLGIHLA